MAIHPGKLYLHILYQLYMYMFLMRDRQYKF